MNRNFGLLLLWIVLVLCFEPVFAVAVIGPVTFFFGDLVPFAVQSAAVHILCIAAASWIVSRVRRKYSPPSA